MNIFLSGKMDERGAWRDAILGREGGHPRWEINLPGDYRVSASWEHLGTRSHRRFPRAENQYVLGIHNYVGPYRITYGQPGGGNAQIEGYFHGSTMSGSHGHPDQDQREHLLSECLSAIGRADLVFAVLNTPDCFGSIAEIGFARAMGKYVYLLTTDDAEWDWSDYWFVGGLADDWDQVTSEPDAASRFKDALVRWTARPPRPAVASLMPGDGTTERLARGAAYSFSQIARWTSDPRVRSEAERMVRWIQGA